MLAGDMGGGEGMDINTAYQILHSYISSFGYIGCEQWNDIDREKAEKALETLFVAAVKEDIITKLNELSETFRNGGSYNVAAGIDKAIELIKDGG